MGGHSERGGCLHCKKMRYECRRARACACVCVREKWRWCVRQRAEKREELVLEGAWLCACQ